MTVKKTLCADGIVLSLLSAIVALIFTGVSVLLQFMTGLYIGLAWFGISMIVFIVIDRTFPSDANES